MNNQTPYEGQLQTLQTNGGPITYRYTNGSWVSEQPMIVVQAGSPTIPSAFPHTHPNPNYLQPTSAPGQNVVPNPEPQAVQFLQITAITEPRYSLSARQFLEIAVPTVPSSGSGTIRNSSDSNKLYANIGRLSTLYCPRDLSGYYNLPSALQYHPIQADPTLELSVEADAIRASHTYIIGPVNMVLFNNSYLMNGVPCRIRSIAEDVHSRTVQLSTSYSVNHISRVDLSWEVYIGNSWHKFAFLEFKRPSALTLSDWTPATIGTGPVRGSGEKICRQIVKYGYSWNVRFVAACTWDTMVLLFLEGETQNWVQRGTQPVPNISAQFGWVNGQAEMKRQLYVFLKGALKARLEALGFQVS